jgi:hypothetical protein
MPLQTVTILDGNSVPLTFQVLGPAPFTWGHVLVDGVGGSNVAQVTTGNALKVDGSAIVQPVSFPGGITVSGAVSITQGGNTANVTAAGALKVDTTGITTVVSGTVTANIGTAGPLALEAGGNLATIAAGFLTQGAALGTNKDIMVAGSVTSVAPTYANGQISPLSLNVSGGLRIDGSAVTQPISGSVSILQAGNTAVVKPASTAPVAADPALVVALSPNSALSLGSVSIAQGGNTAVVKAGSTAPVAADPALVVTISPNCQNPNGQQTSANSSPVVIASDQSAIAVTTGLSASATGATSSRVVSAASVNNTNLKGSAGRIYNIDVFNVAAYDVFMKFYNKATAPVAGTDTPVWTVPLKSGTGFARSFPAGKSFATGIGYAITKLQADSDTTVIAASDVTGAIDWI